MDYSCTPQPLFGHIHITNLAIAAPIVILLFLIFLELKWLRLALAIPPKHPPSVHAGRSSHKTTLGKGGRDKAKKRRDSAMPIHNERHKKSFSKVKDWADKLR